MTLDFTKETIAELEERVAVLERFVRSILDRVVELERSQIQSTDAPSDEGQQHENQFPAGRS
jgi:hypothetical protein